MSRLDTVQEDGGHVHILAEVGVLSCPDIIRVASISVLICYSLFPPALRYAPYYPFLGGKELSNQPSGAWVFQYARKMGGRFPVASSDVLILLFCFQVELVGVG